MAKSKKFKDWMEEDSQEFIKRNKKDSKRYDKKRDAIKQARRQKNKRKQSYF